MFWLTGATLEKLNKLNWFADISRVGVFSQLCIGILRMACLEKFNARLYLMKKISNNVMCKNPRHEAANK